MSDCSFWGVDLFLDGLCRQQAQGMTIIDGTATGQRGLGLVLAHRRI